MAHGPSVVVPSNVDSFFSFFSSTNLMNFCAACLVQRSGWTRDIDLFLHWLTSLHFGGGGFNDAAIAEGLAEALMVCAYIVLFYLWYWHISF